ncbi:MarR family transcriptional regulator [Streptomyces krungchingensis]
MACRRSAAAQEAFHSRATSTTPPSPDEAALLDLAQLVKKTRNGVYQLNAMLAGYLTPADCAAAIADMDPAERLNAPDFVERYHEAVQMYQDELAKERRAREEQKRAVASRRGALHAVG